MRVQVGDIVKIVGLYGGCGRERCKDCLRTKGKQKIKIVSIRKDDVDELSLLNGNKQIGVEIIDKRGQYIDGCNVDERDLKVIEGKRIENWRKRLR